MPRKSCIRGEIRCLVRFEHALLAKMSEELSSGDVLHVDVKIAGVLGESFEVNLNKKDSTMKGWLIVLRMRYSLEMWSTCCDLMSSSFFMILTQKYLFEFFFLTSRTLPKEPMSYRAYLLRELQGTRSPLYLPIPFLFFRLSSTL